MLARSTRRIPYFCNFNFNRTPRRIRNHPIASIAVHSDVRKEALGNPLSLSSLSLSLSLSQTDDLFVFSEAISAVYAHCATRSEIYATTF